MDRLSPVKTQMFSKAFSTLKIDTDIQDINATKIRPLRESHEFENLLTQITTGIMNAPLDTINASIENHFREAMMFFGVNQGTIFEIIGNDTDLSLLCKYQNPDILNGENITTEDPPGRYIEKLKLAKTVILDDPVPEGPPNSSTKKKTKLPSTGSNVRLNLPMRAGGVIVGAMIVELFFPEPCQQTRLLERLSCIGNIFGAAISNKRSQKDLYNLFEFEKLVADISSLFANVSSEKVDGIISTGLERVGSFLRADRCNFILLFKNKPNIIFTWTKDGTSPFISMKNVNKNFPWASDQLINGKIICFYHPDDLPATAAIDKNNWSKTGTKSMLVIPISIGGRFIAAINIATVNEYRVFPNNISARLALLGQIFANALIRKTKDENIKKAFTEISRLKKLFKAENTYLRSEIEQEFNSHNMIGQCGTFKSMISKISQIARTDTTVLILGETGTGKELVARAIHAASDRSNRSMIKVSCAALSDAMIENELFGHEKGAYTTALTRQVGRFEIADGNTLFLDEIGELPLSSQAKLLRVIQEGEFERIGSVRTIKVNTRIIAATNRDLEDDIKKGRFRKDLWYRLNIFPIHMPSLRDRREDIPLLAEFFIKKFNNKFRKSIGHIPSNIMEIMQNHSWPGNIRELENVIERAVINATGQSLQLIDNLTVTETPHSLTSPLQEIEREHIIRVLGDNGWRIEGLKGAASVLGLNASTLRSRMRKLGIKRPESI